MKKIFSILAMAAIVAVSCEKPGNEGTNNGDNGDNGGTNPPAAAEYRMLYDFENGIVTWTPGSGAVFEVADNPYKTGINTSAKVGKITHKGGNFEWFWSTPFGEEVEGGEVQYANFSEEGYIVKVDVYCSIPNCPIYLKFEGDGVEAQEIKNVATTKVNEWETLEYDYETYALEDGKYKKFVLCVAQGPEVLTDGKVMYFDNVRLCKE